MKQVLWLSILVATAVYICGPLQDPDLWWHITVGKWIVSHGTVPHVDYWNTFGLGKTWRAYSWSTEIIFAQVHDAFGERGLLTLKVLVAVLLATSLFYCYAKIAADWFIGTLLGIIATASCFNHFTLRPQALVWIYFIWIIYSAQVVHQNGVSTVRLARVFGIMILWANTHLSSILGIVALAAWLMPSVPSQQSHWRPLALVLLAAFLGTLCTPYLGAEWLTFLETSIHPLHFQAIAEFQPATIMQYSTAFLILISSLLLAMVFQSPRSIEPPKLLLALGYLLGALAVVKFIPFATIICAALVALAWRHVHLQTGAARPSLLEALERLRASVGRIPQEGLSFVLLCTVIVNGYRLWQSPIELSIVPARAVDFIVHNNLPNPILNIFGHGGYLMYRFSNERGEPTHTVAIDGRTNVITEEAWRAYMSAYHGELSWKTYFDLVKPETVLWRQDSPLVAILLAEDRWCLVYRDAPPTPEERQSVVFVKREYFDAHRSQLTSENCST